MTLLRTSRDGCWELKSNGYGQYLAPATDPLADTVITTEQLQGFELASDIPKISHRLWSKWIDLCLEMCKRGTGDLEVSCRFLRKGNDYRICVPVQRVSGASVRVDSFDKSIDIDTGEVIEQWPPEGWTPCGSSHSHNTMDAFFSSTDDQYELGDPGIHIVVGRIDLHKKEYTPKASVTANNRRFDLDTDSLVCLNSSPGDEYAGSYHSSVLDIITLPQTRSMTATLAPAPKTTFGSRKVDTSALLTQQAEALAAIQRLRDAAVSNAIPVNQVLDDLIWEIDAITDESIGYAMYGQDYADPYHYSMY